MAQVEFQYEGTKTIIQCQENQKMSEICNNFIFKSNLNENDINYFYNGKGGSQFDKNLTFYQMANSLDKERKKMNILVINNENANTNDYMIRSKNIICPTCGEDIKIKINNYKIKLFECKNNDEISLPLNRFENTQMINLMNIKCALVNQMRSNTKYVKSFNYPSPNINLAKNIRKKEKIKEEKMNPEIIEFKSEENMFLKMPMPVQNLEPYKSKEKEKNLIFENKYLDKNVEYLMPKHSIKSSNSFKINTKINNKKYIGNNNQNKINDYEMFKNSNNGYILYKNNSNNNISNNKINIIGTNSGKIKSKTMSNYISNNSNLKMTKSSMQISGSIPLSQSQTFNNNINNNVNKIPLSKISSVALNIEGGNSPRKKFQKKNSENKIDINYDNIITKTKVKYIKNNNNKYINNQGYKHQTYLPKKDFINDNIKYNYNSDNLKKELKRNKINNNISNNNNLMNIDNDINFVQPNNEYNNIFFYSSKSHNINDIDENYSYNNDNNPNFQYKNNELNNVKNKYVYKKSDNLSEKQIQKLKNTYKDKIIKHNKSDTTNYKKKEIKKIVIKKQEIKNKLINNFETIDLNIKIPLGPDFSKEEKISINLKEDNIKEKIENLLNKYDLDNSYYEPILSLLNNSINIIGNVNSINLSENINLNNFNKDKLNLKENSDESFDDLNYSKVLDIQERHLYDEFIEKMYSDVDEINENAKILNMSI